MICVIALTLWVNVEASVYPRVGAEGVTAPVAVHEIKPEYPNVAIEAELQGFVLLEVVVRKNGTIGDVKVLRGLGEGQFGFEESAIKAVRKTKFLPGEVNGKQADVLMTLKIDFTLEDEEKSTEFIPLLLVFLFLLGAAGFYNPLFFIIRTFLFGEKKDTIPPEPINPAVDDHSAHFGKTVAVNSDLRPGGTLVLSEGGKEVVFECISRDGFIEKGNKVKIVGQSGPSLLVRRL